MKQAAIRRRPVEKLGPTKHTKTEIEGLAAIDYSDSLGGERSDESDNLDVENGDQDESEGSKKGLKKGRKKNDIDEDDSFALQIADQNARLDPKVKNQKFLKTPLPEGPNPSQSQINMRIRGLHLRIELWVGVHQGNLKEILRAEGWDFEQAIKRWRRDLAFRIAHHAANSDSRTYETILEDRLLSARSLHQKHRMDIDQIYKILGLKLLSINPAKRVQLTSMRCALLLRESE
jgi:hypothetical protein